MSLPDIERSEWLTAWWSARREVATLRGDVLYVGAGRTRYAPVAGRHDHYTDRRRFPGGTVLDLTYPYNLRLPTHDPFEHAVAFHVLEHLERSDILRALDYLHRIARRVHVRYPHRAWGWMNPHHRSYGRVLCGVLHWGSLPWAREKSGWCSFTCGRKGCHCGGCP